MFKILLVSIMLMHITCISALEFKVKPDTSSRPQQVLGKDELIFTRSNTISIRGVIDNSTVARIIKELGENKSDSPILFIHSGGGSVMAGLQLVQYIQDSPRPIRCYASFAASMAFVIFQSCHERYVGSTSTLMQHQSSGGEDGKMLEVEAGINNWKYMVSEIEQAQADRLKISLETFRKKIDNNWFLFGKQILENNAADKVVTSQCESDISSETQTVEEQVFVFTVSMTFSKCPLSVSPLSFYVSTQGSSRYSDGPSGDDYKNLIRYIQKGFGPETQLPQPSNPLK